MADEPGSPAWRPERGLNVSTQLQNLRNLLNSDRESMAENQRRLGLIEQEISLRSNILERQRRDLDLQFQDRETLAVPEGVPTSNSPSSLVRSRRRAFRPSERLPRHRQRYVHSIQGDPSDALGAGHRATPPPAFVESAMPGDNYDAESQINREQRYRAKRRKLDDGTFDDETRIVSYGDEGRVTPGPLKMEIICCDGGDYNDPPTSSARLVLQDDKDVYSTKENKCNMLMKHMGGMPFSLTKIVIKAPTGGFDAPIQEGMIFVAMSDEKLVEKTARYERYSPRSYRFYHPYRRPDYYRPSQEYLNSSRSPLRSIDRLRHGQDPAPPWTRPVENDADLENSVVPGFEVSFVDPSDREDSPSFTPRSPASWRDVDAEYTIRSYVDRYRPNLANNDSQERESETSSESEDEHPLPHRTPRNNVDDLDEEFAQQRRALDRMRMAHERGEHDFYLLHPSRAERARAISPMLRWMPGEGPARRWTPNRTEPPSTETTQDEGSRDNGTSSKSTGDVSTYTASSSSETLAPHARFSMTETQSSVAVNFDPPVAGRYILVKLWATCPATNIDIQCIIPHGYGGPRFFPSIESR